MRVCPKCGRAFILLKTDPPDQKICTHCRLGIHLQKGKKR